MAKRSATQNLDSAPPFSIVSRSVRETQISNMQTPRPAQAHRSSSHPSPQTLEAVHGTRINAAHGIRINAAHGTRINSSGAARVSTLGSHPMAGPASPQGTTWWRTETRASSFQSRHPRGGMCGSGFLARSKRLRVPLRLHIHTGALVLRNPRVTRQKLAKSGFPEFLT